MEIVTPGARLTGMIITTLRIGVNSIMETFEFTPTLFLICALVSAAIANADNRSPLGFFILGGIAPPLALLILATTRLSGSPFFWQYPRRLNPVWFCCR